MPPTIVTTPEPALFKAFLVLVDESRTTRVAFSYPSDGYKLVQKFPIVERFAFPAVSGCREGSLNYTFVLTDEMGKRLYGHTQHAFNAGVVVILSPYPWCNFFANVMSIYRGLSEQRPADAVGLVNMLGGLSIPGPGKCFPQPIGGEFLSRPWDPPGYEFSDTNPATLLHVFRDVDDLLLLLSSLLMERHVVVCGPTFQGVTSVMLQCLAMLTPFEWQHIFVPVIPGPELYDVLSAPTPYFIGLIDAQVPALKQIEIEDLCFVQLEVVGAGEQGGEYHPNAKMRCASVRVLAPRPDSDQLLPRSGRTSSLRWSLRALKAVLALQRPSSTNQPNDDTAGKSSYAAPWEVASTPTLSARTMPTPSTRSGECHVSFTKPSKRSKSFTKRIHGGGAFGLDLDVCGLFLRYYAEWMGPPIAARLAEYRQRAAGNTNNTSPSAVAVTSSSDAREQKFVDFFCASQCFAELADHSAECLLRLEEECVTQSNSDTTKKAATSTSGTPMRAAPSTTATSPDLLGSSMRKGSFNNAAAAAAAAASQQANAKRAQLANCCPHRNPFLHELLQHHPECFPNAVELVRTMESCCTSQCRSQEKKKPRRGSIRALIARTFSCCAAADEEDDESDEEMVRFHQQQRNADAALQRSPLGAFATPGGGKRKMYQVDE